MNGPYKIDDSTLGLIGDLLLSHLWNPRTHALQLPNACYHSPIGVTVSSKNSAQWICWCGWCCWDFAAISNTNCSVFMATNAFLSFFTLCMFHGASVPVHQPTALCLLLPSVFGFVSSDSLNMALNEHSGSMRTDFVLTFSATLIPNTQMQSPVCWWFCSLQTPPPPHHSPSMGWRKRNPKGQGHGPGIYVGW